jgi:uncharacterized membrane protein YbhN (UPF0104 family)
MATPREQGDPASGGGHGPRLRLRRLLLALLGGAALVAGAVALIGHVAQFSRLRDGLRDMSPWWLALAVCGKATGYGGYVAAYRDVARMLGGPRLRGWAATRIVGLGFGATVIGSAAGGLATDYWALHRAGCTSVDALRRVLGLNTLQWLSLGVLAAAAGVCALLGLAHHVPPGMSVTWPCVVAFCVAGGTWAGAARRNDRLAAMPVAGGARAAWPARAVAELRRALAVAIGGLVFPREVLRRPGAHTGGALGFPMYWVGDMVCLFACLQAFGASLGLAALVLAYASGYVATALPLPVGGAGGVEAALALCLHAVGLPLATALLAAVVYRGVSFWLPIVPALALLPTVPGLTHELDGLAGERPAA